MSAGVVVRDEFGKETSQCALLVRRERRKDLGLHLVQHAIEVTKARLATGSERDDLAASVGRVVGAYDELSGLEFGGCDCDVLAVDSGAAPHARLTQRTVLSKGGQQAVVVATDTLCCERGVEDRLRACVGPAQEPGRKVCDAIKCHEAHHIDG